MSSQSRKPRDGAEPGPEKRRTNSTLDRLREGLILPEDAVIELADAGELLGLAALIAERIELEPEDVVRAIVAPSEQVLTILCRAAGLSINGFSAVLRLRCRSRGVLHSPARSLAAFQEMPLETAHRMVPIAKSQ